MAAPFVGQISYISGDGKFVALIAGVVLLAAIGNRVIPALAGGLMVAGFLTFFYSHFNAILQSAHKSMKSSGIFGGIGEAMLSTVRLEWGFYFTCGAALAMFVAGLLRLVERQQQHNVAVDSVSERPMSD